MNNRSLLTGLVVLVLFFALINSINWESDAVTEIGYSDFLTYVERGQVKEVNISGNSISAIMDSGRSFHTISAYDPQLIPRLRAKQADIRIKNDEGTPWYITLLLHWGPLLLLVGVWILMMKKMPGGSGRIMSIGKSKAKQFKGSSINTTFKDVAGVEEAKEELAEIVDYLKNPEKFSKLGGKIPRGALMVGPPGTGKTLLAKAVAGEAEVPFFSISGSDFVEMFVGVGASRVRELFAEAKKAAPAIIFIDEIDAVGRHRGAGLGSGHDEREQTLNALLVEMDGFEGSEAVITLAATNRSDILDPALMRPGRFDREVHINLPDIRGRKKIIAVHAKKIVTEEDIDFDTIAKGTPGFSGAELANLVNESALRAAQQNKTKVSLEEMEWSRDKIMMGMERRSMIMTDKEKHATAVHEAGHALVAAHTEKADPIHKITIIPRGQALGVTAFLPETDRLSMDRDSLLARITVSMGGRAAEELILNDYSTGVEGDLKNASDIAYNMVCKWGMSERLGALTIPGGDSGNYLAMDYNQPEPVSEEVQNIVDEEVRTLLHQCFAEAQTILSRHVEQLKTTVALLLKEETLSAVQFNEAIGFTK